MSNTGNMNCLLVGFADPVLESQAVFRSLMGATAYPGRTFLLERPVPAPAPLNAATAALCLSLADFETPLWLDENVEASGSAVSWLRFHCGVPLVEDAQAARFAIVSDTEAMPHLDSFQTGVSNYPDRSTTLVVQVPSLSDGPETIWTGPGITASRRVSVAGLPYWFWSDWGLNGESYPMGIDVFFTSGDAIIGLPRTIRVEA